MNQIFNKVKSNILLFIVALICIFIFVIDLIPNLMVNYSIKLVCYIASIIIVFIDMKIKNKKEKDIKQKEKNRKKGLILILVVYSLLILSLLLFDGSYRRTFGGEEIKLFSKEHFEIYSNLVPFKTIFGYFKRIAEGSINNSIVFTNIFGNLIAFAPFGILLPLISKEKFSKIWKFTLTMVIIVLIIEIIQFLSLKGSLDIDDLILNVLGAVAFFGICKIPFVENLITKIIE